MRLPQLMLAALLLAACNSILGNTDYHLVETTGGTRGTDAGLGSGGSGGSGGGSTPEGGAGGALESDMCVGIVCDTPPAASCTSPAELTTHDKDGSCSNGTCSYTAHAIACTCQSDACTTDPCIAVTCASPPDPNCKDETTLTTRAASGTCSAGSCSYAPKEEACDFGCSNGTCNPDPCLGVTCTTPPADKCKDASTKTSYAATGTCGDGKCTYAPADEGCDTNQQCGGAGLCATCKADASCGATCTKCAGGTLKCKDLGATSKCVACLSNADCSWPTPSCNAATNVCEASSSCVGLAKTCGPSGSDDCCASNLVTGGTFNRDNNATYPATVSDFRLDNYEITVGRFRKFVAAYSQTMVAAGAGKNPSNASDTGWDTAWNTSLEADALSLKAALKCSATHQTWTDAAGPAAAESRPINCIDWFEAEAFCIWDGGRLPTEAEWNYAAAGGTAQRQYPWGATAPDCSYANFYNTDYCVSPGTGAVNRVGSESTNGDGRYGQSDLAGNVWEWAQDWYASPYVKPCNNCANAMTSTNRVIRGGSFVNFASYLLSSGRDGYGPPSSHGLNVGARCVRTP